MLDGRVVLREEVDALMRKDWPSAFFGDTDVLTVAAAKRLGLIVELDGKLFLKEGVADV